VQDQSFRNSQSNSVTLRGDFALTPSTAIFATVTQSFADFEELPGPFASRDSDATVALIGVNFDIGNLMRGELAAGTATQNFDAAVFGSADAFSYRGAIEWFPTRVITVGGTLSRNVVVSPLAGVGSSIVDGVGAQVDWDVRSNLVMSARLQHEIYSYDSFVREDTRTSIRGSAAWLLSRWFGLVFEVTHNQADSNDPLGIDFDETRAGVRLTLRR
jgi:hypothetical protein